MKLLGRLGWHGQCACCCGPHGKKQIKREEERDWRREAEEDVYGEPLPGEVD